MSLPRYIPISYQIQCAAASEASPESRCGFIAMTSQEIRFHQYTVHGMLQAPSMDVYVCHAQGCGFTTERRLSRELVGGGLNLEDLDIQKIGEEAEEGEEEVEGRNDIEMDLGSELKRDDEVGEQRDPFVLQAIANIQNHYFQAHYQLFSTTSNDPHLSVSPPEPFSFSVTPEGSPSLPSLPSPTLSPLLLPLPAIFPSSQLPPPLFSPTLPSSSPLPDNQPHHHHHHHSHHYHRYHQLPSQYIRDPSSSPPPVIDQEPSSSPGRDPFYLDLELQNVLALDGVRAVIAAMDLETPTPTPVGEEFSAQERLRWD